MDKWKRLQEAANMLSGPAVQRDIWSLSDDPRFAAVLALLADVRAERLEQGSGPAQAEQHGALAHCMGAVDAIKEVERRMQAMAEPPPSESDA